MHHPPKPHPAPEGWLMQKVIACDRQIISPHCIRLCPAEPCRQIRSVEYSGLPVRVSPAGSNLVKVDIPLSVQLCDSCGCCTWTSSHAEVEVPLSPMLSCKRAEHCQLMVLPEVCLLCCEESCGCFQIQLRIVLSLFLVCYELCGRCRPACPQLPLYPPPIRPCR